MTDNEIKKGLEECSILGFNLNKEALDLIKRKDEYIAQLESNLKRFAKINSVLGKENGKLAAEIEKLHKLQKPTETSGYRIENGKVVFFTSILNGYRHEYSNIEEVVNDMNVMLQNAYKNDEIYLHYKGKLQTAKSEAIKEFAELVNPILEEIVDIMFDSNGSKCRIKNCHKHSSIPCDSPTCIEENKAYWKLKIYNLVKEMVGDDNA